MGRASADLLRRSRAIAWEWRQRHLAEPIAAEREQVAADTERAQAALRKRGVGHRAQALAARTARAPRRSPAEGRRPPRAEGQAQARRMALHPRWAKPWLQTDSCLPGSRSGHDPLPVQGRNRPDPLDLDANLRAGERSQARVVRPVAAIAAPVAGARLGAAELPKRVRGPAPVAVTAAREERRDRAEGLPRRPMGCRRTGKTCWWADSRRHTACTRSCENSRARAMPRSLARPSAGSIPVLLHHYAVIGDPTRAETMVADPARHTRGRSDEPDQQNGAESTIQPRGRARTNAEKGRPRMPGDRRTQRSFSS